MDDFLQESSEIAENDLEMTSIDEEDLSFDDLDEFELLDENDLAGTTTDAKATTQTEQSTRGRSQGMETRRRVGPFR